jgi:hypothetical protein
VAGWWRLFPSTCFREIAMRESRMDEARELTLDEMLEVTGGADADRQVADPSHGMSAADGPCFLYLYC